VRDFLAAVSPPPQPSPTRVHTASYDIAPYDDRAMGDTAKIFGGADRLPNEGPYRFAGLPFRAEAGVEAIEHTEEKKRNPRVYTFSDDWLDPALLKALRSEEVGSLRWLLAQADPRSAFQKLKAGEIPEAIPVQHGVLSVLKEEMPGVYSIKCLRCHCGTYPLSAVVTVLALSMPLSS
jgi:hypothetical protein